MKTKIKCIMRYTGSHLIYAGGVSANVLINAESRIIKPLSLIDTRRFEAHVQINAGGIYLEVLLSMLFITSIANILLITFTYRYVFFSEIPYIVCYWAGASTSSMGPMQALYGKPSVDHAYNINDQVPATDKAKATSLPDILLVDFNPCEVRCVTGIWQFGMFKKK